MRQEGGCFVMLIQMAAGCAYAVGPFARELKLQFFLGRAISIDYVGDLYPRTENFGLDEVSSCRV